MATPEVTNEKGYIRKETAMGPIYYKIDNSLPDLSNDPFIVKKNEEAKKWLAEKGHLLDQLPIFK